MTEDCSGRAAANAGRLLDGAGVEQTLLDVGHVIEQRAGMERLPATVWAALLADADTRERYAAKVHVRAAGQCWYWLGAISSSGHGKFRAGSRRTGIDPVTGVTRPPSRVVTSHVYGYQLVHGALRVRSGEDLVIAHTCDEASCHNPAHWVCGTRQQNTADYYGRRGRPGGHPLADVRGPAGRAEAIRDAIRATLAAGGDVEAAIWSAAGAGVRDAGQDPLF